MIIEQLTNSNPHSTYDGASGKLSASGILAPKIIPPELCNCTCGYVERVFAKVGGETYENDKSSFLRRKVGNSDTIVYKLYKATTLLTTLNDSTYGTYYDFTTQKYIGFLLDWEKVFDANSGGSYKVVVEENILGQQIDTTYYYDLHEFDVEKARNYTRIESWQTGNIINSEFNYEGLLTNGWYQSHRLKGRLQRAKPKLTIDNYLNKDYELLQIQDSITNEYQFETNLIPRALMDELVYDNILANRLRLTDFYSEIIEQNMYCVDIPDKKTYQYNKNEILLLKFVDKIQNILKHN